MIYSTLLRSSTRSGITLSEQGVAVYAAVRQSSGTTQWLVAAKSQPVKQGLTIPRVELVAAHMATDLLMDICNAETMYLPQRCFGWLDSTIALHWIKGNSQYKQFVANRVAKIQLHKEIEWTYIPTDKNAADLASIGAPIQSALWQQGPASLHVANQPSHPFVTSIRRTITDFAGQGNAYLAIFMCIYCIYTHWNSTFTFIVSLTHRMDNI